MSGNSWKWARRESEAIAQRSPFRTLTFEDLTAIIDVANEMRHQKWQQMSREVAPHLPADEVYGILHVGGTVERQDEEY